MSVTNNQVPSALTFQKLMRETNDPHTTHNHNNLFNNLCQPLNSVCSSLTLLASDGWCKQANTVNFYALKVDKGKLIPTQSQQSTYQPL